MSNSLKTNACFNVAYKVLNVIFPLITSIYISRVLMPSGLGEVSFALSIAQYFLTLAALGLPSYGVREISRARSEGRLDIVFSELIILNAVASLLSAALYCVFVFYAYGSSDNLVLHLVFVSMIALNLFNIDWFYQGIEEYGYIAIRSMAVKIFSLVVMLFVVKDAQDTFGYAVVLCIGSAGNYLLNVIRLRRFVRFRLSNLNIVRHIRPALYLLLVSAAADLYGKLNTTLLGVFSTSEQVGYFTNAVSCLNACLQLLLAITGVFLPRLSLLYKTDREEFERLVNKGIRILLYFGSPMLMLIVCCAHEAVIFLFGEPFSTSAKIAQILSPLVLIKGVGDLMCFQVLLAANKESYFLPSRIAGAVTNLLLGIPLICEFGSSGAAMASVLSEFAVNAPLFIIAARQVKLVPGTDFLVSTLISLSVMAVVIFMIQLSGIGGFLQLFGSIVIGGLAYLLTSLATNNEICWLVLRRARV